MLYTMNITAIQQGAHAPTSVYRSPKQFSIKLVKRYSPIVNFPILYHMVGDFRAVQFFVDLIHSYPKNY